MDEKKEIKKKVWTKKKSSQKNITKKETKKRALLNSKKYVANLSDDIKEEVLKELVKLLPKYEVTIEKRWPGQPTVIKDEQLQVLKICLASGMKMKKALFIADIKRSTLSDYRKRNPKFSEELMYVRDSIDDQAILNLGFAVKAEKKMMERHIKENKDWPIQLPNTKYRLTNRHPAFKNKLNVEWTFTLVALHNSLNSNINSSGWEDDEFEREFFNE